ncbi:CBS domain-containing protein [Pyrobaculum aerophilum]|uniref:Histidine kinase n=1 Tax=Pyrobaculum aerophilum TaxID=13773 RepID=A0A371QV26_9CREN|nr:MULTISPECIES: CBS domain-containing protein [Pyrobaculum]MCX8137507.1 CBS domain-containing protein [Pyrobaculum aerophilum]RFA93910.1 histidine kinase [Pyrobaculum aerophilum]RFA96117.1 histidine kinase [Pyrobaculum aerophilum]
MIRTSELLKRPPVSLPETATIREVAAELAKNRVGLAVLTARDNPKRPVAVVSERDILRAVAQRLDLDGPAMSIANSPITVLDTDPVHVAAEKMRRHNIRHVVVVNKNGELVGVLSIRDLCFERAILLELATAEVPATP